jgi:hypothetical protein
MLSVAGHGAASLGAVTPSKSAELTLADSATLAATSLAASLNPSTGAGTLIVSGGSATIGTISGGVDINLTAGPVSSSAELVTIGASSGNNFFGLAADRLDLLSTATTSTDTIYLSTTSAQIDLVNIACQPGETALVTQTGSFYASPVYSITLDAAGGQALYTFQNVYGAFGQSAVPLVALGNDGAAGTLLTIACFVEGTRIETATGESSSRPYASAIWSAPPAARCAPYAGLDGAATAADSSPATRH